MGSWKRTVCLVAVLSYSPFIHSALPPSVLRPRLPRTPSPDHIREIFASCQERIRNSNPYAAPVADLHAAALARKVSTEIPQVLRAVDPRMGHADMLEIEKFLRREWVLESHPEHPTFKDMERAKVRALHYLADYVSATPVMSYQRSAPVEEAVVRTLSDFALNAKSLTPEARDRLVYALVSANRTVPVPRLGEALSRWVSQGDEPAGHFFTHLLWNLHEPVDSERRPPLDVVLESVDLVVKKYQASGYRSTEDKNRIQITQDYLEVLRDNASLANNHQLRDIAGQEAQRLHVVLTEKRDPIYRVR
jgi:hypothetical protein